MACACPVAGYIDHVILWGVQFSFVLGSVSHFAILSCFNPAETFHFAFRHVCLRSRPSNNPINARAPRLGPRLSLFSEVSYYFLTAKNMLEEGLLEHNHINKATDRQPKVYS